MVDGSSGASASVPSRKFAHASPSAIRTSSSHDIVGSMMDSLDNTDWDVVICGTGLPQSLLALALSRSELKVLHVDPNKYYGGHEAALSLSEAETWAEQHAGVTSSIFGHASVTKTEPSEPAGSRLLSPRAYSLALAPQLIYSRSSLIDTLVSSHTHTQLEFQAVGSWFIVNAPQDGTASQARLTRVPGGREGVFQDNTLDLKEKRALMKFLRFVVKYEEQPEVWQDCTSTTFPAFLQERFNLPPTAHAPILALSMQSVPSGNTGIESTLSGISRYLTSIGYFGAGFGAVLPKWGGLAELGQVACRACAVGGGVYVLGQGISEIDPSQEKLKLRLSNGEHVTTKWVSGSAEDLPGLARESDDADGPSVSSSISIVSSRLVSLFPHTSEGGVTPAGAVVFIPSAAEDEPPVYILVHSSESGECPSNQCVLYAFVSQGHEKSFPRLQGAIQHLLFSVGETVVPQILWSMNFQRQIRSEHAKSNALHKNCVVLNPLSGSLVLEDSVLDNVKDAWQKITGAQPETFMKFELRDGTLEDDDA